jgi:hypothetical protein
VADDAANVGQKAHVAHGVRLVEHEHFDTGQVDGAVANVVQQAAGAGYDDVSAAAKSLGLRSLANASVYAQAPYGRVFAKLAGGLVNLLSQFAGGCNDQRAYLATGSRYQPLEYRKHEAGGLASAGLGQSQDVATFERDGNRLLLNRRGGGVACGVHASKHTSI